MPTAFWLLVDFLIIYYVVYRILLIIKGTRAVPMLIGLLVLAVIYGLSQHVLNLPTFSLDPRITVVGALLALLGALPLFVLLIGSH